MTLNISNDEYYCNIKKVFNKQEWNENYNIPTYGSKTITHSFPAYDLWRSLFPTIITERRLLKLHRRELRPVTDNNCHIPVKNVARTIIDFQRKLRLRVIRDINKGLDEQEIVARNFLIRRSSDLTAKRGELLLFEYMEEYPPILSQVGMASNIKTYTRKPNQLKPIVKKKVDSVKRFRLDGQIKSLIPESQYHSNETTFRGYQELLSEQSTKPIYFNRLKDNSSLRVIENNLYRAPIYNHLVPETDFIIIRTRNSFYIRAVKHIFTVGQIYPLVIIPPPVELNVTKFRNDLALFHLNNMMTKCSSKNKQASWEDLHRLFPDIDCKRFKAKMFKLGAKRVQEDPQDDYTCYWSPGTTDLGSVPLLKARYRMRPEQYCINMSMMSGRQLLRSWNYREAEILEGKETEVKAAPWNTTKAVINSSAGRCYLDLKPHLIDPTGIPCSEGFSCIPLEKSCLDEPSTSRQQLQQPPDKNHITRENVKRLSVFQNEAQVIAEIQNKVLATDEILTSDEEDDEASSVQKQLEKSKQNSESNDDDADDDNEDFMMLSKLLER